ncbi:MAG TPA: aspartate/glutamate racemase family protein [Burkholderiaceae bacterium]|nr:aspartate/glutamate racemase family protein [Burkholderiaceae bacterium]
MTGTQSIRGAARDAPWGFPARERLGVLMLDTRFVRLPGDIGHPATFDFPVCRGVVDGATPRRVVHERDPALLRPFIAVAQALIEAQGATAITTSCGFLVLWQRELEAALPVPVWTSSLLLLPGLAHAGVVTVDASALTVRHLMAAGGDPATPVEGLAPGCALQRTLLEDLPQLDAADAERQVVAAAERLLGRAPELTDIVLECTNMAPHAQAVRRATGRRVHDITTLIAQRFGSAAAMRGQA